MNTENQNVETVSAEATQSIADAPQQNEAQAKAAEILAKRAAAKKGRADAAKAEAPKGQADGEKSTAKPKALTGRIGIRFLRDIDPQIDRFNNQQNVLIQAMMKLRKTEGDDKDIVYRDELLQEVTSETLNSRQPAERVLGFYMNTWKKNIEATDKKPAVPALFEVVRVTKG